MRLTRLNPGFVSLTAIQSLSKGVHDGKTLLLGVAAGHTITLPPATGSGCKLRFITTVTSTGSVILKVQNTIDVMYGNLIMTLAAGGAVTSFSTVAASDTITLNHLATGGAGSGELIEFEDTMAGFWFVMGVVKCSTTPTTPFSAGV